MNDEYEIPISSIRILTRAVIEYLKEEKKMQFDPSATNIINQITSHQQI